MESMLQVWRVDGNEAEIATQSDRERSSAHATWENPELKSAYW